MGMMGEMVTLNKKKTMLEERHENGILAIAECVIIALLMVCVLSSCATKKKVVKEKEYEHDTLLVSHRDTFFVEKWNYKHDTIKVESERIVTLMQSDKALPAETVKVVTNNWRYEREIVKDSTSRFVIKIDSILKALDQRHEAEKVITKTKPPWDILIFIAAVFLACVVVLRSKK